MAAKPRGLGKGLDSLIPNTTVSSKAPVEKPEAKAETPDSFVDINLVEPNREQPRKNFDEKALNELIYQIDAILVNKKEYNESFVVSIDSVINTVLPMDKDYKTVYNVFRMIAEELELED